MAEVSWPDPAASHAVLDVQYEELMSNIAGDGIAGTPTDAPVVFGDSTGMQVKVNASRYGLVRGHAWTSGSTLFTKTIAANASGNPRIDLVVLQLDRSTWKVTTVVKTGTPAAVPTVPALQQDADVVGAGAGKWEIPLASVAVANGAATITAANVTPLHWYLGAPILQTTPSTRPSPRPGMILSEAGDYLVAIGSAFVRLTTINEASLMAAAQQLTNGGYPYVNNYTWGWFSQLAVPTVAGHAYEIRLDCTAASGDTGNLPITVRVGVWLGGVNYCFDERVLTNTNAFARFTLSHPYVATSTATQTFLATAERRVGNARFDIRVGTDMPLFFRAMDLGNRTPIGGS